VSGGWSRSSLSGSLNCQCRCCGGFVERGGASGDGWANGRIFCGFCDSERIIGHMIFRDALVGNTCVIHQCISH
jgi:hypothetical protein